MERSCIVRFYHFPLSHKRIGVLCKTAEIIPGEPDLANTSEGNAQLRFHFAQAYDIEPHSFLGAAFLLDFKQANNVF